MSSTEIPKAILKTRSVEGFNGIPNQPIIPAVKSSGMKLGISETITIRHERKSIAIRIEIAIIAKIKLVNKLITRYFVPSDVRIDAPVIVTSKYSLSIACRSCDLNSDFLY